MKKNLAIEGFDFLKMVRGYINFACKEYNISRKLIFIDTKDRTISNARALLVYILRREGYEYDMIARVFETFGAVYNMSEYSRMYSRMKKYYDDNLEKDVKQDLRLKKHLKRLEAVSPERTKVYKDAIIKEYLEQNK